MAKVRTTLTIDEEVLKAVRVKAARTGKAYGQVIEEALRRDLGFDALDRLWQTNDLTEDEANALAVEAQHETRGRAAELRPADEAR
jgi:Ribbon-helix-helix protein, copG family